MIPFMRYAKARLEQEKREFAYRIFLSDCIGHLVGLNVRYVDLIDQKPVETRTAEQIKTDICAKLAKIGGE